jgi:hypothetical protein
VRSIIQYLLLKILFFSYFNRNNVNYYLLVDILFIIRYIGCDISCIDAAKLTPTMNISLPNENNTLVGVYVLSVTRSIQNSMFIH